MTDSPTAAAEQCRAGANVRDRFLRLTIARKMLLGYFTLVALIFLISTFSISNLHRMNDANTKIITTDLPLIETSEKMMDLLISEELHFRRSVILQSQEIRGLGRKKGAEFDALCAKMLSLQGNIATNPLLESHKEYSKLLEKLAAFHNDRAGSVQQYESALKTKQEQIIGLLREIAGRARKDQNENTVAASRIGTTAFRMSLILSLMSVVASMAATVIITKNIAGAITRLKEASAKISQGTFDVIEGVDNRDELGELSITFNEMTKRLKWLEATYLDASPLTRLPGNIAIENVLKNRIETGKLFAFCHIDLDNFKAFNDRYGYAKGSEVILATSNVVKECVFKTGVEDDFVGHIGGDDFVLITTPDHFRETCARIIETFDKTIPRFYDPADAERGFIVGTSRKGEQLTYPIMSISIAVVTNANRALTSSIEVGQIAAELKEYAKSLPGSVYVVDRRRKEGRGVREHA